MCRRRKTFNLSEMAAIKDERSRSMLLPLIIVAVSSFTFVFFVLKSLRTSSMVTTSKNYYFNLMEDGPRHLEPFECTQDSMNALRLEQDHPCVIEIIRKHFLHPPSSPQIPYNFVHKNNPIGAQTVYILNRLMYPTEGFFVECGAYDGELISNTLYMERVLDWNGILIEANPDNYEKLRKKNRKAWSLPVCLSLEPYPTTVQFAKNGTLGKIISNSGVNNLKSPKEIITVQCFPFYSILLAVNQTSLDYFSLDVEGHELFVLKTIPWHKVDIKTLSVEYIHHKGGGEKDLIRYMKSQGYLLINRFTYGCGDVIFMSAKHAHDYLQ